MIPKVAHSRSQLFCNVREFEDGATNILVSGDTYPELFDIHCPDIVKLAPKGWRMHKSGKMKYLWVPPGALDAKALARIKSWQEHFQQYVLLGLNKHIADSFSDELDFCMALSYNRNHDAGERTHYGEAEYQLKYRHSTAHFSTLESGLAEALGFLPIPLVMRDRVILTAVPSDPAKDSVAKKLAVAVAQKQGIKFVQANILCNRTAMKNLPVKEKIPVWEKLYGSKESVELTDSVKGATAVVIDDLYQSGATMWCYAKYLKGSGAKHVLGLPCVKSLKDTDNQ